MGLMGADFQNFFKIPLLFPSGCIFFRNAILPILVRSVITNKTINNSARKQTILALIKLGLGANITNAVIVVTTLKLFSRLGILK